VVHSGSSRRRGKPRSRILYWFRTPPGVRVGRAALDEEAIKLIEEYNPDVEFDWTRILKGEGAERRPKERESEAKEREPEPKEREPEAKEREPEAPRPIAPGETSPSVAEAKLGAEALGRLRARHAEILARISESITDPVRRDELKAQAERLNPDTWVTDAEVATGLESYEAEFELLRTAVGRRRKRRRSRKPRPGQPPAPQPQLQAAGEGHEQPEEEDPEEEEDEEI
jgi:hypothetical protein